MRPIVDNKETQVETMRPIIGERGSKWKNLKIGFSNFDNGGENLSFVRLPATFAFFVVVVAELVVSLGLTNGHTKWFHSQNRKKSKQLINNIYIEYSHEAI